MKTSLFSIHNRIVHSLVIAMIATLVLSSTVFAQDGYRLRVDRNVGFSSGSQIRGDFTIHLSGDQEAVAAVTFLLDGEEMATVTAAPFRHRFSTQNYPEGVHEFTARVTLKDGTVLETGARRFEFVSGNAQTEAMLRIIVPLLGIVLLVTALGAGGSYLAGRGKPNGRYAPGEARHYGFAGGAICPKCNRPTPIHIWGINLLAGRWDYCENCFKFSLLRRAPLDILRAAETAEREAEKTTLLAGAKSEEEKLRELLDQSRYSG
ncbi:MAG: Ig-like domain-containing protein [Bellilinea sp.]|jgi:hypothetical protein